MLMMQFAGDLINKRVNLLNKRKSKIKNSIVGQSLNSPKNISQNNVLARPKNQRRDSISPIVYFSRFNNMKPHINYDEGIRLLRLNQEGRAVEIFESDEEGFSSDEDEEKSLNKARITGNLSLNKLQRKKFSTSLGREKVMGQKNILKKRGNSKGEHKKDILKSIKKKSELLDIIGFLNTQNITCYFITFSVISILMFALLV